MKRFTTPRSIENFRGAVPHIRRVLDTSPEETLANIELYRANAMPSEASLPAWKIASKMAGESLRDEGVYQYNLMLFEGGFRDTASIVDIIISKHYDIVTKPDGTLDIEKILRIMSRPTTISSIARLALRSDHDLTDLIAARVGTLTPEGDDLAYTVDEDSLPIGEDGCPAAGFIEAPSQEGRVAPLRIFNDVINYSSKFYLLSDERRHLPEE